MWALCEGESKLNGKLSSPSLSKSRDHRELWDSRFTCIENFLESTPLGRQGFVLFTTVISGAGTLPGTEEGLN